MYRKRKMYRKNGSSRNHRQAHGRAQDSALQSRCSGWAYPSKADGARLLEAFRTADSVFPLGDCDDGGSGVSVARHFEFGNRDGLFGNDGFDRRLWSRRGFRRKELGTVEQGAPERSVVAGPGAFEIGLA